MSVRPSAEEPTPHAGGANAAPAPAEAFSIPSLDGIRAFSFLTVFLSHAGLSGIVPGYFGLSTFFFLSGYLITTLLRMEFDRTGDVSFRQFYLRRVLRIFPPFYLVLGAASVLTLVGFLGGSLWPRAVLAQACHVTNYWVIGNGWWNGMAPGTWVYWSLAIEEHFYLVFPLAYLGLRRLRLSGQRQALVLLAVCSVVLAWRFVLVYLLDASREYTYLATDTRVDSILAGCILAVWRNPVLDPGEIDDRRLARLWLPLGLVSVGVSLAYRVPQFEQTWRYTMQSFGLFPVFAAAIRWHDRGIFRLLNWRPVRYVGLLSYSLYLMHPSALYILEKHTDLDTPVRGVITFVILVAIATLIYRYVEKPCAKIRRNLARYMAARSASGGRADSAKPIAA